MTYPYQSLIATYAALESIKDPHLIAALIKNESNFNPNSIGDSGLAIGLGQLHPAACTAVGADWKQMQDPEKNIKATCAYFALMLKICSNDIPWALAAYNQGPTVISRGRGYSRRVLGLLPAMQQLGGTTAPPATAANQGAKQ